MNRSHENERASIEMIEHIRTIRKAIDNDKLVVFVGSGVSCDSGLPSWGKLIDAMRGCISQESETNYLKIAEKYYHQNGRNTYYARISEFFPDEAEPNELHRLLLRLNPRHIVTTNWDRLIEKEMLKQGGLYYTVATDDQLAASPSSQLLIKMHGDLSHRNIIFKESDYSSYADSRPLIENYIKSLFSTNIVLFIGYSLSDYNLDQILSWTRNRTNDAPPCYAIFPDQVLDNTELHYFKNKGVFPILVPATLPLPTEPSNKLSDKGQRVAALLSWIIDEEVSARDQQVSDLLQIIKEWNPIHPSIFVRLAKHLFRFTSINKIYFDSEHDAICYKLDKVDMEFSRSKYRAIRKQIRQILLCLPVREAWLLTSVNRGVRLVNSRLEHIHGRYGLFDFSEIAIQSDSFRILQLADPEICYDLAFSRYFQHKLSEANDLFAQSTNLFFQQKRYARSLLSAFSRKHSITSVATALDSSFEKIIELQQRESLQINDSVNKEILRFPRKVSNSLSPLLGCLSSNNSLCLEQLLVALRLNNDLKSEARIINKGGFSVSSRQESVKNLLRWIIDFALGNKIAIIYNNEFRLILKTHFNSLLSLAQFGKCPSLDSYICYSAIVSYEANELSDFLFELLDKSKQVVINIDAAEYILMILGNCLGTLEMHSRSTGIWFISCKIFNTAITLLSFCAATKLASDETLDVIARALQSPAWLELADSVNRYIALRERYAPNSLSVEKLDALLDEQITRLSHIRSYTPLENRHILPNLLELLSKSLPIGERLQNSENSIDRLLLAIKDLTESEKPNAISDILFPLFWFASGEVKLKIKAYLQEFYHQISLANVGAEGLSFSLKLYSLEIVERDELELILGELARVLDESRRNSSYSSSLFAIERQLQDLPEEAREKHRETILGLSEATSRMRLFWSF